MRQLVTLFITLSLAWMVSAAGQEPKVERWYKGNTHTHTLWSDGDGAPEMVADWYVQNDYDFLVLSDHNVLSQGETWFPIDDGRLTEQMVAQIEKRFGKGWVVRRKTSENGEMRLKTLADLKRHFSKDGDFLFIPGEEITDSFEGKPVHINAINLVDRIYPKKGGSVQETIQNNLNAVMAESSKHRRPMLAHLNHPNFDWGISVEDLAAMEGERFFEVYNGHSGVRNYGDEEHASSEQLWDQAMVMRLREMDLPPLLGLATDDAHNYHEFGVGKHNPGRGWVMVKATELTPDAIVRAMRRGDFYSSSGVTLKDVSHKNYKSLSLTIDAEEGVRYTTQFIGTRANGEELGPIGDVLFETTENPATYEFQGDELYVRAKVTSSKPHPNPYASGDKQCAWVQPVTRPLF